MTLIAPLIITFGDSTTAPRKDVEVYTTLLEQDSNMRWLNRGVPGNTTEMARARFENDVLKEKPQVVVIQFGINDSTVDVWKTPPETQSRVSLPRYEENLRFFIRSLRASGARPILMTSNPLRWTPELKRLYGKPPYDPDQELGFTGILGQYAAVARKVASEEKVPLVDIYARYTEWEKETGRKATELLSDGMHPNSEGQRLVAEVLKRVLDATERAAEGPQRQPLPSSKSLPLKLRDTLNQ